VTKVCAVAALHVGIIVPELHFLSATKLTDLIN